MSDIRQNPIFIDDFNRPDENPLAGGWARLDTARQPMRLISHHARHTSGSSSYSYWPALVLDNDDAESWGYGTGGNASGNGWRVGLARQAGGGPSVADGYIFLFNISTGGGSTLLQRITNMGFTTIASSSSSPSTGNPGYMLCRRNGNAVEGWGSLDGVTWTKYVSANDTTYMTGLSPFLGLSGNLVGWVSFGGGKLLSTFTPQIYRKVPA